MEIATIHNQFSSVLQRFVSSRVSNNDDAQDILQDIFIKISKSIHQLSDEEKLKSWIFTIARNAITDYYRKNANKKEIPLDDHQSYDTAEENDSDFTKGIDSCLSGFIQKLPHRYKEVIIDSEIKGISQKILAEKYDLAYPSLRSRIQRGRAKLKDMLVNCCSIELDRRGNIISASVKKPGENICGACD